MVVLKRCGNPLWRLPYPKALTESLQVAQLLPEQLLGHLRIPVLVRIREPIATRRHRSANPP